MILVVFTIDDICRLATTRIGSLRNVVMTLAVPPAEMVAIRRIIIMTKHFETAEWYAISTKPLGNKLAPMANTKRLKGANSNKQDLP